MSIQARLEKLDERHQELESALARELNHAALNTDRVSEIKRRKLAIKDEMQALQLRRPH